MTQFFLKRDIDADISDEIYDTLAVSKAVLELSEKTFLSNCPTFPNLRGLNLSTIITFLSAIFPPPTHLYPANEMLMGIAETWWIRHTV